MSDASIGAVGESLLTIPDPERFPLLCRFCANGIEKCAACTDGYMCLGPVCVECLP